MSNMRQDHIDIRIQGTGQTDFVPIARGGDSLPELLFQAAQAAVADAGLQFSDLDGFGLASFTADPDHAIDFAVRMNIRPRWLMDSALGGASGNDLLAHAVAAISTGSASKILLLAGDHFDSDKFTSLVRNYNSSAVRDFSDMPYAGPNAFFALLTEMQKSAYDLTAEDYGALVTAQRAWAAENPHAAHRSPLTIQQYLEAPLISDPLGRFDCVPVVTGAVAVVVSRDCGSVRILGVEAEHNFDGQTSSGLATGLSLAAPRLWEKTNRHPNHVDVASIYDDYPAMVVSQLLDCGFLDHQNVRQSLAEVLSNGRPAINSSGGQLSAGQAGAGAGLHGVLEVVSALRDRGPRKTHGSQLGLVTGYGMVTYRYGSCANVSLLERV